MAGKLQIINYALRLLKQSPIVDVADQNERARVASDMYEITRLTAFSSCDWHCLRKRVKLTKDMEPPAFGFKYRYLLPVDCVRVIGVQDDVNGFFIPYLGGMFPDDTPIDLTYTIEGDYLLSNQDTCNIMYVVNEQDPTKYDAQLTNVFAYLLALNMAIPLTADNSLAAAIENKYTYFLKTAKSRNALDATYPTATTPFVARRF